MDPTRDPMASVEVVGGPIQSRPTQQRAPRNVDLTGTPPMTAALMTREQAADLAARDRDRPIVITNEQTDLIRKTIAAEASDAELALFFYDCRRRGVHPLDKLIHFTKRKGKYTPVTSIDFFRSRAAQTHEHMGTDDAVYTGDPEDPDFAATVTVYRMVQGEKCPFTATARYGEYVPADDNAFMWRKMPHNQLGKCAEALALRKAFPQELENLHTTEELARDDGGDNVTTPRRTVQRASASVVQGERVEPASLVTDARHVKDVRPFGNKGNYAIVLDGDPIEYTTKAAALATEIKKLAGSDRRIRMTFKVNDWNGKTYRNVESFTIAEDVAPDPPPAPAQTPPLSAADIPFSR